MRLFLPQPSAGFDVRQPAACIGETLGEELPDQEAAMETAGGRSSLFGQDPVCPRCRTIYNRTAVIRQLREQSPFLFGGGGWATKFKCVRCGEEIGISGWGDR